MSMKYSDIVYSNASTMVLDRIVDEHGEFDNEVFNQEMELELLKEIDRLFEENQKEFL